MLLNEARRAEAVAEMQAQEVERKRERDTAERARRGHAAMGVLKCLLELQQPVRAAQAARARLHMCDSVQERRQVFPRRARAVKSGPS